MTEPTNYKDKMTWKELRGTPADPNKGIEVAVYDQKTKKIRRQILKRFRLIDKLVIYDDVNNVRSVGKCVAFCTDSGQAVIVAKDEGSAPHTKDPNLMFVL